MRSRPVIAGISMVSFPIVCRPRRAAGRKLTKVFVDTDESLRHTVLMQPLPRPTEAELAILQVLWDTGPLPVREIQRTLDAVRPTGYTTVLKMLQIMLEKGLVLRDDSVRPQIYRPTLARERTQRQILRDLTERAFGGSVKALVLQALATRKSTPEELDEIEKLLDRFERKSK